MILATKQPTTRLTIIIEAFFPMYFAYYFISPIILSRNSIIQDVQQLIPQIMWPRCNKVTGTISECSLHGKSYVGTKLSLTKLLQILQ